MKSIKKLKDWLTLARATRIYLWWVAIRWVLRWVATALFLMWIWFLAPEYRKNELLAKFKFKTYEQKIEWDYNNQNIQFGLMEDGSVRWRYKND